MNETSYDEERDRLLCELVEIESLRTSHPPETLEQPTLERIRALMGTYAYLPVEAVEGATLHLKQTTLTGEHGFFSGAPPGTARSSS